MTICDEIGNIKEVAPSSGATRVFEIPPCTLYLNMCLTCKHQTTNGQENDTRHYCVRITPTWKGYEPNKKEKNNGK